MLPFNSPSNPKLCPGPKHTEPPSDPPSLQSHPCLKEHSLMGKSGKMVMISARIKIVVYLNIDGEIIKSADGTGKSYKEKFVFYLSLQVLKPCSTHTDIPTHLYHHHPQHAHSPAPPHTLTCACTHAHNFLSGVSRTHWK